MSYNRVILMGHITRDLELKYTSNGKAFCNFGIAINEGYVNAQGNKIEQTVFVACTAWEKKAEFIAKYFTKGQLIHIDGKLRMESWDDKQTGQKRTKLSVNVFDATFCGPKPSGNGGNGQQHEPSPAESYYGAPVPSPQGGIPDSQIPF